MAYSIPTRIYKAHVTLPFGKLDYIVAVDEATPQMAKDAIINAVMCDAKCSFHVIKVGEVSKSSRRLTQSMLPIIGANAFGRQWAWIKPA